MSKLEKGDWVQVWGQVTDETAHPEDVVVEFFSHSEQWRGHVRLDRVQHPGTTPPFAERCTHLLRRESELFEETFLRCEGHHGHGRKHHSGSITWGDKESFGYIEEAW